MTHQCELCESWVSRPSGIRRVQLFPSNEASYFCANCADKYGTTCVDCTSVFYGADGVSCPVCDSDCHLYYGADVCLDD